MPEKASSEKRQRPGLLRMRALRQFLPKSGSQESRLRPNQLLLMVLSHLNKVLRQ